MLTIGKLGAQAGVKVPTIRYYEQIGILPEAERSAGNQRLYSRKALERLAFIRHARDLGFTLEAIRDLLSLSDNPDQSCGAADAIAKAQLAEVESRLARLTALKAELERMVVQCAGGKIADCRVIEVLGDHSLCVTDHRNPESEATPVTAPSTLAIYAGAALAEIAGCFAVWACMRQGGECLLACPGLVSLAVFAWLLTLAPSDFAGRAYAAYGGVYIAASLLWLWMVEKQRPDTWDLTGAAICLAGAAVILFLPRTSGG